MSIYFLTVNYNSSALISRLLESISAQNQHSKYQVVIVNNSPEDSQISDLDSDYVKIIQPEENLGFGRACNLGLNWINQQNSQAIIWLINPDVYFDAKLIAPGTSSIETAIALFKNHPQISILGTTVCDRDHQITSAGGTFTPGTAALATIYTLPKDLSQDYVTTDWVSGCSLLINLANFSACPQFDPRYFLYYEDLDFCRHYSQQEHLIAVTHQLKVIHDTSSITNRYVFKKYKYITQSYLIHIEKYGSRLIFIWTNIRLFLNTFRLILIRPQQGLGKLSGLYNYWKTKSFQNRSL